MDCKISTKGSCAKITLLPESSFLLVNMVSIQIGEEIVGHMPSDTDLIIILPNLKEMGYMESAFATL